MTEADCFKCHDPQSRLLLPNAKADLAKLGVDCMHPLRITNFPGAGRTATQVCLTCHKPPVGYVTIGTVEIDISKTHPIGLHSTATIYPDSLPLSVSGAIDCVTCHDQHGLDKRLRLIRMYYPGNGHPPDFQPLCKDCHHTDWVALLMKQKPATIEEQEGGR